MTGFERVKAALEHREPDKVPFDLGASVLTGMNRHCYENLRSYLGLPAKPAEICDEMQQLARIDPDVLERLEVDVSCVDPSPASAPGLRAPIRQDGEYYYQTDEWGVEWKMPVRGGHYFDMCGQPLAGGETPDDVKTFPWPDPADPARFSTLKERADRSVFHDKKAYILGRQYAGIWETALWMNGFEKFFCDMMINKSYAHALMETITELKMRYWEKALEAVGDNVLIVSEADDLATQSNLLCSLELYQEMVSPYHRKLFSFIRQKAKVPVHIFYHTCGAVVPLIPILIDEGVDVLNPVQVSAAGMDSQFLKREFGKDMTFWGGGVDTQRILPFGTPNQIRDEVRRRIEDFSRDGGFVFAAVHNVQSDVPPQNFMAMWDALQEFGWYSRT